MKKILITGGAGFIGSNLADRLLKMGNSIVVIDNFNDFYDPAIKRHNVSHNLTNPDYRLVEGDITDKALIDNIFKEEKFEMIVHLAARAGVRPSIKKPREYFETNVIGTINLLEAMRQYGPNKLVFASSSSVYGNNPKVPFSETDLVDNPVSPYAASKKSCELIASTYHGLYGFHIFAFRFFSVYGPRQRPEMAIASFAGKIIRGEEISLFGDGSSSRDYTYIDDIIDGLISSLDKTCGFEIFNLGESTPITLLALVELLEKKLGKKAKIKYMPAQPGDVERTFADVSKSKKILGYNPSTSIDEGIEKYCNWLKKNDR